MKLFRAAVLILCLFMGPWGAYPAFAKVSGGLKLGRITSELPDLTNASRTGVIAGIFGTFRISGLLAFQPEGLYAQKGAKDLLIHYLEFPMLARLDLSLGGLGLYAVGGPSFAFRQSQGDLKLDTSSIETVLGAGIGFSLGRGTIGLESRYQRSLGNLNAHTDPALADRTYKNKGFSVFLSYSWSYGGG